MGEGGGESRDNEGRSGVDFGHVRFKMLRSKKRW